MSNDISSVAGAVQQSVIGSEGSARGADAVTKQEASASATPTSMVAEESRQSSPKVNAQLLAAAIEQLNSLAEAQRRELQFSIDEPTGKTIVKVFDSSSQELIRQIPAKEVLELAERFGEGDTGALMHVVA